MAERSAAPELEKPVLADHPAGSSAAGTSQHPASAGHWARAVLLALGAVSLGLGLVLPWLSTALGVNSRAAQLSVRLPGWRWLDRVTYQHLVVLVLALVAAGVFVELRAATGECPNRRRATSLFRTAGAVGCVGSIGFLLQLLLSDAQARLTLQGDQNEFTLLTSQLTYRVPQPQVSQLLFFPLNHTQTLVFSALRMGWCLTFLGAVLLVFTPKGVGRAARPATRAARPTLGSLGAVLVSLLVGIYFVGLLRGAVADLVASDAAGMEAAGRYPAAAARYADALSLNPDLAYDPAVAAGAGRARVQSGLAGGSAAAYAVALDQSAARGDLDAMTTLQKALSEDPDNPLLARALTQVAVGYALKQKDPGSLSGRPVQLPESVLLRFTRGRLEVATGQLDAAITDLKTVGSLTHNADVRSAALTYISIAQQRSGDLVTARRTLEDALTADSGHYNLVARALAAGLYSGFRS